MSRSIWKGPFIDGYLLKKIKNDDSLEKNSNKTLNKKPIKTWSRRSMIIPELVGLNFHIYNGKGFIRLLVTEDMIGHKFGEFASTRKKCVHDK